MTELLVVVILLQVGILVLMVSRKSGSSELLEEFSRFRREVNEITGGIRNDLDTKLELMRATVDEKLQSTLENRLSDGFRQVSDRLGEANELAGGMRKELDTKLELIRATVDEKLQSTLEKRLSESFQQVSERLEKVHQGLGEMQTLAVGVGDLKKVLGNVKTRGTWGEVQLGALLEQVLTTEQFGKNVAVTGTSERVEYAVRLPGHDATVWLPIDAKFPMEDYQRLVEASEVGDAAGVAKAIDELEKRVWVFAKSIRDKYIAPPLTTDFGILFLPTEGLYAEMMRRTAFVDEVQRELRVTLAGPSTLLALLNSLQMGFRTLEIQKRSSEVWELLGAVKGEFLKYHAVLGKVREKLDQAARTIDDAEVRTRQIQRKLKGVEEKGMAVGEITED